MSFKDLLYIVSLKVAVSKAPLKTLNDDLLYGKTVETNRTEWGWTLEL